MKERLSRFRVILAEPRTAGNVGATARATVNFECRDWAIVAPQCEWNGWDARRFATGDAHERLEQARITPTLGEAVQDCQIAIGFTRRNGKLRKPSVQLSEIAALATSGIRVALVFGNEETGLSSAELKACTKLCTVDTSVAAPSMNLSHAVSVVLSRIYSDLNTQVRTPRSQTPSLARLAEFEGMMSHWEEFLRDIGLTTGGNPARMVATLRRTFTKMELTPHDVRTFRGLLSKTQVKLGVRRRGKRVATLLALALLTAGATSSAPTTARAATVSVGKVPIQVQVEPIIGLEVARKSVPNAHSTTRLVYGGRITAGYQWLSLEAEYTRSSDNEAFPAQLLTTTDSMERLKVGLRGSYPLGHLASLIARGGGEAQQNRHDETQGTDTYSTIEPVVIKPYLGTGFSFNFSSKVSASAEVVATFNSLSDVSQTEYQTTGGISVHFP